MIWYHAAVPVLGDIGIERLDKLEEIRRLLLAIIPRERGKLIRPKSVPETLSKNLRSSQ